MVCEQGAANVYSGVNHSLKEQTEVKHYGWRNKTQMLLLDFLWLTGEVLKMLEEERVSLRDVQPASLDTMCVLHLFIVQFSCKLWNGVIWWIWLCECAFQVQQCVWRGAAGPRRKWIWWISSSHLQTCCQTTVWCRSWWAHLQDNEVCAANVLHVYVFKCASCFCI